MSAYVDNLARRQGRSRMAALDAGQVERGERLTWSPTPAHLLAARDWANPPRCQHCTLAELSHLGPYQLCPEWALRAAWGS